MLSIERPVLMLNVTRLGVSNTLSRCPECGYQNGFHVGFKRVEPNGAEHKVAVHLICPSCSAVYDIGLRVCVPEEA